MGKISCDTIFVFFFEYETDIFFGQWFSIFLFVNITQLTEWLNLYSWSSVIIKYFSNFLVDLIDESSEPDNLNDHDHYNKEVKEWIGDHYSATNDIFLR